MTLKILAGKYKNQKLIAPKNIRPITSKIRCAIFNICQNIIENSSFLDIFSGSGALGIEALSRGAGYSTFIDNSKTSCKAIKENIKKLNLEKSTTVICQDAIKSLKYLKNPFDIISIDPPFQIYKTSVNYINSLLKSLVDTSLVQRSSIIFLEQPTYIKRKETIEGLELKKKRKYSSAFLLEYVLK